MFASHLVEKHFLHRGSGLEFEMEADWAQQHLATCEGPVLDIGCGNGALLSALDISRRIGLDRNSDGLAHTRQRFPTLPLVCADADRLPFADGSLPTITLQHLIEHLPHTEAACREWFRVLRPEGLLLVMTPNSEFCDPSVYEDETHTHVFDRGGLQFMLRNVGFEIVDLRTLGLPWFRHHRRVPGSWRLRRLVTQRARWLSSLPPWRWKGQTLCCAARRPA